MYSGPILVFSIGVLTTCFGVAILSIQEQDSRNAQTMSINWDKVDDDAGWHQAYHSHSPHNRFDIVYVSQATCS